MPEKRALITGIGGFVGQRLSQHLAEQGWEVKGSDIAGENTSEFQPCDLRNLDELKKLLAWAAPLTHVFHLAASTFVPDSIADPNLTFEINIGGTVSVTRAMMEVCPTARLIVVGSSESYGPPMYLPQDEEHPLNPQNPYAISKAASDHYCEYVSKRGDLDIIRMRPYNHSGPGQNDRFVLSSFARQMAEVNLNMRDSILRVGNLDVARDFSHVDDVICAYEAAALRGESGDVYNVCSGNATTLTRAIEILSGMLETEVRIEIDPKRFRTAEIPEIYGTHEKLTAKTGWTPVKSFEQIMQDLFLFWETQLQKNEQSNAKG
jgi:GDP-4-dehydro-6-deoxy-D-mannose reductase